MSSRLRPQLLDMQVIELVDLVLAGRRIEDDLAECKGEWPDPQKRSTARQLAGHANKARDEPILWIVGLNEKAHSLTSPSLIEFADWWASVTSCFDPPAPELEHHRVVPVGEQQAVTALRFLTDGSPYVIKGGGVEGTLEREVPIRDGAGTRSARRDELLRLLAPAIVPPSAELLSASLQATYFPDTQGGPGHTNLFLTATVFFQQPALSTGVVMLPAHLMHTRLDFNSNIGPLRSALKYSTDQGGNHQRMAPWQQEQPIVVAAPTILHGVDRRKDGVVITGPGSLTVSTATLLDGDLRSTLAALDVVQVALSFGVAGVERRIQLNARLNLGTDVGTPRIEWNLRVPVEDPWAEVEEQAVDA